MKVLVVYYSLYGHVRRLALAVAEGVESVPGVELVLRRVREFEDIEREVIPKSKHFGNMTAQMKRLFDSAASLWLEGTLEGKPAGMFVSTATTHGGQETTPFTMMAPLLHLGMIIVGVPYSTPGMLHTEGRGGSPYASSTVAGSRNELTPTPEDLDIARALGKRIADIAKKLRG
jgi:NAD(P)H dehydrogenase (quinone)